MAGSTISLLALVLRVEQHGRRKHCTQDGSQRGGKDNRKRGATSPKGAAGATGPTGARGGRVRAGPTGLTVARVYEVRRAHGTDRPNR
jgi:hypothetical protein